MSVAFDSPNNSAALEPPILEAFVGEPTEEVVADDVVADFLAVQMPELDLVADDDESAEAATTHRATNSDDYHESGFGRKRKAIIGSVLAGAAMVLAVFVPRADSHADDPCGIGGGTIGCTTLPTYPHPTPGPTTKPKPKPVSTTVRHRNPAPTTAETNPPETDPPVDTEPAAPLVIGSVTHDSFLRLATICVVVGGLALYSSSDFSILHKEVKDPSWKHLLTIAFIALAILLYSSQYLEQGNRFLSYNYVASAVLVLVSVVTLIFCKNSKQYKID